MPHGGDQASDDDSVAGRGRRALTLVEPGEHRADHLVEGQPLFEVKFGGEAHLGVDDAVGGEVFHAFSGDPAQRAQGLHHRDRVPEGPQVLDEGSGVGAVDEPPPQLLGILGGQLGIPRLACQVDDGGRAQPTIEVVVQDHLGRQSQGRWRDRLGLAGGCDGGGIGAHLLSVTQNSGETFCTPGFGANSARTTKDTL